MIAKQQEKSWKLWHKNKEQNELFSAPHELSVD